MVSESPQRPVPLYHWSPAPRRTQIIRRGLVPGSWSIDHAWRAPYVALSDSPSLSWGLSGGHPRGEAHPTWDLWMVWSDRLDGGHVHLFYGLDESHPQEVRVFQRIYKRDLWMVGTRQRESANG